MRTNAHMNNHMHTDMHVHMHTYMHTHVYAFPLSPICMLSLVMSQLRICLQVTINLSSLGIGPHRNQANNPPQQNAWKTPAENSPAQWSCRSTAYKFNKNFLPPQVLPPTLHQSKSLTQPPYKPALRQERVNTKEVDMKTLILTPPSNNSLVLIGNHTWKK